jgi:gluconolactonase
MHSALDALKIEVDMLAPGAERIVGRNLSLDVIARDIIFGEGPVWDARNRQLFFTDIIGDTIWKWKPRAGLNPVLRPSVKANGLALDRENRLLVAGWGGRTVFRFEKEGSRTTLADRWGGKKLNSPNDIVVKSDGSIWFTDPPGGLLNVGMVGDDLQRYLDIQGVFRISPDGKHMSVATPGFIYPNGLCFSPDEKLLYVNCSRERVIRVYDVSPDGSLGKARLFYQYLSPERGVPTA